MQSEQISKEENNADNKNGQEINKFITFEEFLKIEIKLGTVIDIISVDGSDKLYKLTVDFGEDKNRTIFSGIKNYVSIDDIKNKQFPFVTNLAPRKIMGEYSEGMILAADYDGILSLFSPTKNLPNGTSLH